MRPAGFWRRYAAWSLDAAIVALPVLLLAWSRLDAGAAAIARAWAALNAMLAPAMIDAVQSAQPAARLLHTLDRPAMHAAIAALTSAVHALVLPPVLGFAALWLLYHVVLERGEDQATPGQRALGLVVASDPGQRRLTAGHALLRHLAGGLSWLSLNVGHAMAALPPRHRSLHDLVSGSCVLQAGGERALPAWARAWIALQLCALLAAHAWLLLAASAAMQRAVDGALSL